MREFLTLVVLSHVKQLLTVLSPNQRATGAPVAAIELHALPFPASDFGADTLGIAIRYGLAKPRRRILVACAANGGFERGDHRCLPIAVMRDGARDRAPAVALERSLERKGMWAFAGPTSRKQHSANSNSHRSKEKLRIKMNPLYCGVPFDFSVRVAGT